MRARVVAWGLVAMLGMSSTACALFDAARTEPFCNEGNECCGDGDDNDGDGDIDCADADCVDDPLCGGCTIPRFHDAETLPLTSAVFDTCQQIASTTEIGAPGATCGFVPSVSIIRFTSPREAVWRLCFEYGHPGDVAFSFNGCGNGLECFPGNGMCRELELEEGDFYLLVPASPAGDCGEITIDITEIGDEICGNGVDDSSDGLTDCEDETCQLNPSVCQSDLVMGEDCNGVDDGVITNNLGSFPAPSIDEAACKCTSTEGCDQLPTGSAPPYICHPEADGGVCAPDCSQFNWCPDFGLECGGLTCRPPS